MNSFKAVCLLAVLVLALLNQRCIGAEEIKTPDPNAKENLIDNGSFESDAIKPWVVFGGPGKSPEASLVADNVKKGKQAVRITNSKADNFGGLQIPVKLPASFQGPLLIAVSAKRDAVGNTPPNYTFGISLQAGYTDGTNKWENPNSGWLDPKTAEWQTRTFVWTPAKPLSRLSLRLMFVDQGSCLFDNIQVRVATTEDVKNAAVKAVSLANMQMVSAKITATALPVNENISFEQNQMPGFLKPHIGEWKVENGMLSTAGSMPEAGWYLRSEHQYQYDDISFRVRKESPDGILYLHTRHWKFMLRPNQMMVKNVEKPNWWLSCARDISFADTNWHTLRLVFKADALSMFWDGKQLQDLTSSRQEWKNSPYAPILPEAAFLFKEADEIFVLHPYRTGAQFDDLKISGIQNGPAQGFLTTLKYPDGRFIKDNAFVRLAPDEPVEVNWKLPAAEQLKEELPALETFQIARPFCPEKELNGTEIVNFRVGKDPSTKFPPHLMLFRQAKCPQKVRLHFQLGKPGIYTLQVPISGAKNLQQLFEVTVDGKVISREVYRGLNSSSFLGNEGVKDYIPLKLDAGYHRIDLILSEELVDKFGGGTHWKRLRIGFNNDVGIQFVPGHIRPEWNLSPSRPQHPNAFECPPQDTEWFSKEIRARIADLPNGDCTVRLGFQEVVLDSPGDRLMDILLNGKKVAENFDIVREAGSDLTYITRNFPATVADGKLLLELKGKNFQACVNYIEILQNGKSVFRHNAGWMPRYANWGYFARFPESKDENTLAIHADPAKNANAAKEYEGHNLVANPSFTLAESEKEPACPLIWRSATELANEKDSKKKNPVFQQKLAGYSVNELTGTGEYLRDTKTFHSAPAALRVDKTSGEFGLVNTFIYVDYHKQQKLSAFVKTSKATGKVRVAIYWFNFDFIDRTVAGITHRYVGRSVSDSFVTATQDWTEISVTAKPPFGAIVAAPVLIVEDNTSGSVWIDDVTLDGYGAEPIEITGSHLGLHPNGVKRFLVKTLDKEDVSYRISDEKDKTVLEGKAVSLGDYQFPHRRFHAIDADSLLLPGKYKLKVTQGKNTAESEFSIDPDVYAALTKTILEGLIIQQFNVEVPGWHGPTHLEDYHSWALVNGRFDWGNKATGKSRQGLGGFYDAGDRIKHWTLVASIGFGTMLAGDSAALPGALSEQARKLMLVALDSLAAAQLADGYFYSANKPYAFDDIPKYGIERYDRYRVANPQAAGIFAKVALELKNSDPARSKHYAGVADKIYRSTACSWEDLSLGNEKTPFNKLLITPKMLFAETYLSKLTGDPKYIKSLDKNVELLCELIEKRTYLEPAFRRYGETTYYVFGNPINFDFLWAPTFFLREYPKHPLAERLKKAMLVFVSDIERLSNIEPWRQAMDLEKEGKDPARFPSPQPISYWTMLGCGLARLGMELDRPDIVRLGERQLQWALGNNPYDVSVVPGIGDRFLGVGLMMYWEPEYYLAHPPVKGKLVYAPGCVPKTAFRTGAFKSPSGYSSMPVAADYAMDPGVMEYWQMMTGNFAAGAAAMHDAMQWIQKNGKP